MLRVANLFCIDARLVAVARHTTFVHAFRRVRGREREDARGRGRARRQRAGHGVQADLASHVPQQRHELVIQLFVLDCFDEATVTALADRLAGSLEPGGCRLLADFCVPPAALRSRRARFWLFVMYRFFRIFVGLRVRTLVGPTEARDLVRQRFLETDTGFLGSAPWAHEQPG